MKAPDHPAGPAFDKARGEEEQRQQQRIAALSREQHRAFARLQNNQEREQAELRKAQHQRLPGEVAARMRQNLLQQKEPHLRPDGRSQPFTDSPDLERAITDLIGGRQNRIVSANRMAFNRAHRVGRGTVAREHAQEREGLDDKHIQERERFLSHAERARGRSAKEEFREKAKGPDRPSQAFGKAARDPSYRRAFERAARAEAEHERTNEPALKKTFDDKAKPRERTAESFNKAVRDPSLTRAFDRAARPGPDDPDGPNNGPPRNGPDLTR